jgi:hypothetical protein
MKDSKIKKPKNKEPEIDFTQFSMDDIAKRVLETPPKPKIKNKKRNRKGLTLHTEDILLAQQADYLKNYQNGMC